MAKFMYLYKGEVADRSTLTDEQNKAMMDGWSSWMGAVGAALVDIGSPLGGGTSMVDDGTTGSHVPISGYSVVEAADLGEAKKLADGHPFLSEGSGNYAIEIYQIFPAPF